MAKVDVAWAAKRREAYAEARHVLDAQEGAWGVEVRDGRGAARQTHLEAVKIGRRCGFERRERERERERERDGGPFLPTMRGSERRRLGAARGGGEKQRKQKALGGR
eukprot:356118-Chlamydomonas_euryale.AAC.12